MGQRVFAAIRADGIVDNIGVQPFLPLEFIAFMNGHRLDPVDLASIQRQGQVALVADNQLRVILPAFVLERDEPGVAQAAVWIQADHRAFQQRADEGPRGTLEQQRLPLAGGQ